MVWCSIQKDQVTSTTIHRLHGYKYREHVEWWDYISHQRRYDGNRCIMDHISNALYHRPGVSTWVFYHCEAYLWSIVSIVCTYLSSSLRQDLIAKRGTTLQFAICSFHLICSGVWSIGQKGDSAIARTCGHYDSQRCHILNHIIPPSPPFSLSFVFLQSTIYAHSPFTPTLTHISLLPYFAHTSLPPRSFVSNNNHFHSFPHP